MTIDPGRDRTIGLVGLILLLTPVVAAIGLLPGFVTQDGPSHAYNARVLLDAFGEGPPSRPIYEVRLEPIPNWAGHLALMGLLAVLPDRAATASLMVLTLVGFASAMGWLRVRVAGWRGFPASAALSALLAMNLTWLFGFYSYGLGCASFAVTLGVWWGDRDRPGFGLAWRVGLLLVVGWFCHPISLAITAYGLIVLAVATPGTRVRGRLGWTLAAHLPLVPLAIYYRSLMKQGGPIRPIWDHLEPPFGPANWREQLAWVDPVTLGRKTSLPFVEVQSPFFGLLAPVTWLAIGLALLAASSVLGRRREVSTTNPPIGERRGWAILALTLVVGGILAPDTLGPSHGYYLAQRVFLLGLAACLPLLDPIGSTALRRIGTLAVGAASALQAATLVDYAIRSDRLVGPVLEIADQLRPGDRIGALWVELRGPYRANPLLHSESLLGLDAGRVVWSNYESSHYYFPVHVRPEVPHPPPLAFEEVSIRDDPADAHARAADWERLLTDHAGQIDALIERGHDARLDAITERSFRPYYVDPAAGLTLWRRKVDPTAELDPEPEPY